MKKNFNLLMMVALAASLLTGCGSAKDAASGSSWNTAAVAEAPAMAAEGAYDDSYSYDDAYLYDAGYGEYEVTEEVAAEDTAAIAEEGSVTEGKAEEITENSQTGRKLITTMNLSAETEHFDELMANLESQITALGGYIESSDQWNGSADYYGNRSSDRNASLIVRVPAERLNSFLAMMEENSNITRKSKSVEDVTLAYVDLESHKKALLAEEERLLELLEMAETVEDLITVEDKLANVRYQLESMESQLRTYDNKINYSTVYLDIQEVARLTPVEEPTTWNRIKNGFSENMYNLGEGIKDFLIGVVINIPYIVMWIILLGIGVLIGVLVVKHDKKKKEKRLRERQQTGKNTQTAQAEAKEGPLPYGVKKEKALFGGRKKKDSKAPAPETEQERNEQNDNRE